MKIIRLFELEFCLLHGCMCFAGVGGNMKHFAEEKTDILRGKLGSCRLTQQLVQSRNAVLKPRASTSASAFDTDTTKKKKNPAVLTQQENTLPAPCFHRSALMNYTGDYYGYSSWIHLQQQRSVSVSVRHREKWCTTMWFTEHVLKCGCSSESFSPVHFSRMCTGDR